MRSPCLLLGLFAGCWAEFPSVEPSDLATPAGDAGADRPPDRAPLVRDLLAGPTRPDAFKPAPTMPDLRGPGAAGVDVSWPDVFRPDLGKPDVFKPDLRKPDLRKPDLRKPDLPGPPPCPDSDGDGWTSCAGDCDDSNPSVHPGQTLFFTTPAASGSFDYDCDGDAELQLAAKVACTAAGGSCSGAGWEQQVPACGALASWAFCFSATKKGVAVCTPKHSTTKKQACR